MAKDKARLRNRNTAAALTQTTAARRALWRSLGREVLGLFTLALGLLAALALASYDAADPVLAWVPVNNAAGAFGALLASALLTTLGPFGAGVPVVSLLFFGGGLLAREHVTFAPRFWAGAVLLLLSFSTLPALLAEMEFASHSFKGVELGAVGTRLAGVERLLFSVPGALGVNFLLLAVGVLGLFNIAPGAAFSMAGRALRRGLRLLLAGVVLPFAAGIGLLAWLREAPARVSALLTVWRERRARRDRLRIATAAHAGDDAAAQPALPADAATAPAAAAGTAKPPARAAGRGAPAIVEHARAPAVKPEQDAFTFSAQTSTGPYLPPDVGRIFQPPQANQARYDKDSLLMNSRILEKKLADFGVNGRVVTVHPGPVITMYEFEPAPGVKVNRITNLTDDLALALRALSIRIIAPIPGKSVVGIEVPNPDRETVYIRDLLESKNYRASGSKLTLALGKDIFGNPVEADLAAMPHLLVAGATGTGKSVFLNSLLCSILCRATPDEVKLLLVDPKMLELSIYDGIPHLIAEPVTNPKRAASALMGVVTKMEERYQRMAALGVRNISQYNEHVEEALAEGEKTFFLRPKPGEAQGEEVEYARLPYIVVVIDELADLMLVSKRAVEESLQRLAQMARASGIHLVLATQRPSVDVLTGIIKANFPSRISFQVSSRADSQTILDQSGADVLLGMGDMLFLPPGTSKLQRLHGSFVTEREVADLVKYLRTQGQPNFDETLLAPAGEAPFGEAGGGAGADEEVDEHYDLAVQIVTDTRNASISYIQRRLKVGYNRAARMIERMEHEGVVGPQIGAKGREVLARAVGEDGSDAP